MSKEMRSFPEVPQDPMIIDFVPEFLTALEEQIESDYKRWGNTWLNRPKEGQELRTKARYTDYFDMFEQAGTPIPWLKIVGGALICWIRENHPELCPDVNEVIAEDMKKIGFEVADEEKLVIETTELEEAIADEVEKAVEDMTAKELVESPSSEPDHGTFEVELGNGVRHKSDCAVHNEPAFPAGECNCQDCNLPSINDIMTKEDVGEVVEHKPGCAFYNNPPAGFASSVTDCDCQGKD